MEVRTTFATIRRDGSTIGPLSVDVIDDENGLRAVLDTDENGAPTVLAVLNPRYFHDMEDGTWLYEMPIFWPAGAFGAG